MTGWRGWKAQRICGWRSRSRCRRVTEIWPCSSPPGSPSSQRSTIRQSRALQPRRAPFVPIAIACLLLLIGGYPSFSCCYIQCTSCQAYNFLPPWHICLSCSRQNLRNPCTHNCGHEIRGFCCGWWAMGRMGHNTGREGMKPLRENGGPLYLQRSEARFLQAYFVSVPDKMPHPTFHRGMFLLLHQLAETANIFPFAPTLVLLLCSPADLHTHCIASDCRSRLACWEA